MTLVALLLASALLAWSGRGRAAGGPGGGRGPRGHPDARGSRGTVSGVAARVVLALVGRAVVAFLAHGIRVNDLDAQGTSALAGAPDPIPSAEARRIRSLFRGAQDLNPDPSPLVNEAELASFLGRDVEAVRLLRRAVADSPGYDSGVVAARRRRGRREPGARSPSAPRGAASQSSAAAARGPDRPAGELTGPSLRQPGGPARSAAPTTGTRTARASNVALPAASRRTGFADPAPASPRRSLPASDPDELPLGSLEVEPEVVSPEVPDEEPEGPPDPAEAGEPGDPDEPSPAPPWDLGADVGFDRDFGFGFGFGFWLP